MLDLSFIVIWITITLTSSEMEPFIVGGDYTHIQKYPHSVYMIVDCMDPFICGGSILTERIVLTAGHCLYPCNKADHSSVMIKYGHRKTNEMATTMASKFYTHKGYNDELLVNDIAMAYTEHTLSFSSSVQRVAILGNYVHLPRFGYVAGWGVINSKGEVGTSLKHVKQTFPSGGACHMFGISSPGIICTGDVRAKEYPDQGDSGSALIIYNFIQIGIVSFKHPKYGLIGYTNTTYYYDWIISTSKAMHCSAD